MKLKNVLLTSLSFVLVAAIAIGGTVAYLTDRDSDVNVMTMGEVSIKQIEQERDENGDLVVFTQAKPALPAVGTIAWAEKGVDINGTEYKVFDEGLKNVVDKIITVKNTGKSEAFVRTIIAIEAPDFDPNGLIHVNINGDGLTYSNWIETEINGEDYVIMTFTYTEALAPNEISAPSLMQVFLDKKVTNEDVAKFGDTWEILAVSQAVQAEGFDSADEALDEAFGEITTTAHPWAAEAEYETVYAANDAEFDAAIKAGAKQVVLSAGTYTLPNGSDVTVVGESKDVVIDCTTDAGTNSKNVKFVNVTIQGINKDYTGMKHTTSVTYEDCLIKDSLTLYANDVVFKNCEFNVTGRYIWTYGANNVLFEGCTFNNLDSRAILVYQESDTNACNVTVKDCSFTAEKKGYTGSGDWTAAIEIDASGAPANVTVENTTVDANYSAMVRIKKGENNATVTEIDNVRYDLSISTAEELIAFAADVNNGNSYSGKTVVLTADIDLTGKEWTPIGQTGGYYAKSYFQGNFNGMNHTVSNMTISKTNEGENYAAGFFGFLDCGMTNTIENIVFDNASVKGHHWTGVAAGYLSGKMNNVKVINSDVTCTHANDEACGDKAGAVVGYINGTQGQMANCSALNCAVAAGRDAGQVVGAAKTSQVTGCSATGVTVTATGDCNGSNINEAVIGRVL